MAAEQRTYIINNTEYHLKEKYTLKDWGRIIQCVETLDKDNIEKSMIILLAEDKLGDLLNLILDKPISGDLYEEDFDTVNKVTKDFFSRKNPLTGNTTKSS